MSRKTKKDYPADWDQISRNIKIRDNWRCQECGLQFSPKVKKARGSNGKLQTFGVHHKDRNPMNSDPDNLIALCSACHCRAEWPLIRAEMQQQMEEQGQMNLFSSEATTGPQNVLETTHESVEELADALIEHGCPVLGSI